ncbi:890_t:CDS:2, partial [Racocetra fulgida]
ILAETQTIPGGVFILTTKHGLEKKDTPVVQPGKLDHYSSLSTDEDGHLLDYAFCRISNDNRVPLIPNNIYQTHVTVSRFKTSISNDPNNETDEWVEVISAVFDPPRKIYALYLSGNNGAF